jgi:hypothetical protein
MSANIKYLNLILVTIIVNFIFAIIVETLVSNPILIHSKNNESIVNNMKSIENEKVSWKYDDTQNKIHFYMSSPEKGWIAIGLNEEDSIVGADLFMINKLESSGEINCEHQYVTDFGKHPSVDFLNKKNRIVTYTYLFDENRNISNAEIVIRPRVDDESDRRFMKGKKVYLFFAYSRESDFSHHSIYRKHFLVEL